jgi:DNA-binding PucR family transcriptional regulator
MQATEGSGRRELGVYSILVNPARSDDLATFLRVTIGPLTEHDATHGTALVDTVHAYFREGTNLARTARALYVHPNTVVKRLGRVADLLGDNWQSPDRALELHMALQLRALADRV